MSQDKLLAISAALSLLGIILALIALYLISKSKQGKRVQRFSTPPYLVTGTLGQIYMISVSFQNATRYPFQQELPSGRTCIYFGNGWLSVNNSDPTDVAFGFNDNEDHTLAVRITDLNSLIKFTPNVFGTWEQ